MFTSFRITIAGVLATGLLAMAPSAASAFEPIEGVWQTTSDIAAEHLWQQTAPGTFHQYVIQGTTTCQADANGFLNDINLAKGSVQGSGLDYSGTAPFYSFSDCSLIGDGQQVVHILSTDPSDFRMAQCSAQPGTGAPQYDANYRPTDPNTLCTEYRRIRPPEPPITSIDQIASLSKAQCTRRRAKVRVGLTNPANEPLLSAVVKLGRRTVVDYEYPGPVPNVTKVRLPAKGGKLTVSVETTTHKSFSKTRRYHRCGSRHRRHHR
jgi:hypothetical protein